MKLEMDMKLPDLPCCSLRQGETSLRKLMGEGKTAFLFLRYYGCRICQLDLHHLDQAYGSIREKGGTVVAVLQSSKEVLKQADEEKMFPYDVISDPQGLLYREFEILPAKDQKELTGGKSMEKVQEASRLGFQHGAYEGEELQLPAAVAVEPDGRIFYVRYGANAADLPSMEELEELLQ